MGALPYRKVPVELGKGHGPVDGVKRVGEVQLQDDAVWGVGVA